MSADAVATLVSEITIPDTGSTRADLLALMRQAVELYSGPLAARLMPALLEETRRNPELATTVRDQFLAGRTRGAERRSSSAVFGVEISGRGLDLELALDVLGGAIFYRLLVTGGPIDERLARRRRRADLARLRADPGRAPPNPSRQRTERNEDPRTHRPERSASSTASCSPRRRAPPVGSVPPGPFSEPLPIHCWAIEHEGVLRLVDTGETAAARNVPFARMEVTREQELPAAMAAAGLRLDDVSEVVLTHAHGDHIDGLVHYAGGC